jgi:hypothetical protein
VQIKTSVWLPDLDIAHLEQCLLIDSQGEDDLQEEDDLRVRKFGFNQI